MHSKGFAHRDLKCSNILLDSNYNIKICDMGVARPVGNQTSVPNQPYNVNYVSTYVGTKNHMAPELIELKYYRGTEVDLFALGVIFFFLYAGHLPFEEASKTD